MLNSLLNNIDADPSVRAAQARLDAALSDQALQKSETGAQLFVGANVGKYNELVTDSIIDDHYARTFVLGVRYPLLGTLKRQLDALKTSEFTSQRQHLEISIRRAERRLALRTAYADWWESQQEQQWCKPLQATASKALGQLENRKEAGWLLASDATTNRNGWNRTLSLCSAQNDSETQARAMLELLAQKTLPADASASDTPLMANPAPLSEWRDALEKQPRIAVRHNNVTEAAQNRTRPWYDSIDSNVSVGYSLEDRSGTSRNGRGLVASLNFTMPFDISGNTSARRTASSARYRAAQEQLLAERRNLTVELGRLLQLHQQSRQNLVNKTDQFTAAKQHLNEMQARTVLEDDNVMLQIQQAQREYYQAGLDRISAWHQVWINNAAILVFAEDGSNPEPLLGNQYLHWQTQSQSAPTSRPHPQPAPAPPDIPSASWTQGVYVWKSSALLDPKLRTAELRALQQAGMSQIYLGLDAAQIQNLETTKKAISSLIKDADKRKMRISLLLGDPAWLQQPDRNQLIALIKKLKMLPFSSLHLDLEVEQQGWPVPQSRLQDWLDTVKAAADASPWPIELSSHYRWFAAPKKGQLCVPCNLSGHGVKNVSLMIYTHNPQRSATLTQQIARRWPKLVFRLAQSVEPQLSAEESWAGTPPRLLARQVEQWRNQLMVAGVTGIDWQSWADFPRSFGHEK